MQPMSDELISVQLDWSDWHTAMVPLSDLRDVHWYQPSPRLVREAESFEDRE